MKRSALPSLLHFFVVSVLCMQTYSADLYVADYSGDIQAAVTAATNAGDTVWVEDGTYVLTNEIYVAEAITIRSTYGVPEDVIIDGGGSTPCFYLDDVACTLSDLTIQNGYLDGDGENEGAGIYCDYSDLPIISNCVIRTNYGETGSWSQGGGLFYGTAIDCLIENNEAGYGGAAAYSVLINCRVKDNLAGELGGGLYNGTATNCTIFNNEAYSSGGGLANSDAYGCAISGNIASFDGGGAYRGTLHNCTLTANTSDIGGGAYDVDEISSCILWHNIITGELVAGPSSTSLGIKSATSDEEYDTTSDEEYATGSDLQYCWDVQYSCAPEFNTSGTGNITNNPVLVTTSHIATNSPCIGLGTNSVVGGTDIDGESWATPASMGCDENHGSGFITGPLDLSIVGAEMIATDFAAPFIFQVSGAPSLVVATLENFGTVTNPLVAVEGSWTLPGTNDLILTAYNDTNPSGVSVTQQVIVVSPAAHAVYVSNADGSDANDGSSWALANETIQAGIDIQDILGGWVLVADGTYSNEPSGYVEIDRPVTVKGTNSVPAAIIDGKWTGGVYMASYGAVLQGFIVQNVEYENDGAGIYCDSDDCIVRDCIIRDNRSDGNGGGMYGGTAINCTFYRNTSEYGGSAIAEGTAIGCVMANNEVLDGIGAAYFSELRNCTVVANQSSASPAGTFDCDLFNCIVWHNTVDGTVNGANIQLGTFTNVCSPDVEHGIDGCITNNPVLASSSHLSVGSPCIGAGSAAEALETDLDGQAWLTPPSIGCDEPYSPVTGKIELSISGITNCVQGTTVEYSFTAIGGATQAAVDFGDSTTVINPIGTVSKVWNVPGSYDVTLTAWNDTYPAGISITQQVMVISEEASTIHVTTDGNDANDGSNWALAKQTIQGGVDAQIFYGGRVLVSNGTYAIASPVTIDIQLQLIGLDRDETIIDGGGASQCLTLNNPACSVEGFCITNGYGENGGGISCISTAPVITNCLITGCEATEKGGGGYYGTYIDCIISGNTADDGGGFAYGAGIDCLIADNDAVGSSANSIGGGVYYSPLTRCIVEGNSAGRGGGIANYYYNYEVRSCLIRNNTATDSDGGGGYYGHYYNCTIVSNRTSDAGGGTYSGEQYNCIIWGNFSNGTLDDLSGGSQYNTCCSEVSHGSDGNITNNPQFVDRANGDYRLAINSPCIDAGDNTDVSVTVDLDGNPRIVNGTVDMGAYEFDAWDQLWLFKSTDEMDIEMADGETTNLYFDVWKLGPSNLPYSISADVPWLVPSPVGGELAEQNVTIELACDSSTLSYGTSTGVVTITAADAVNAPQTITVFVYVPDPTAVLVGDFESGMGIWGAAWGWYDFTWTRRSGNTPSSSTGPSEAAEGNYYMYTEATGNFSSEAAFEATFDFTENAGPKLTFKYHMYGSNMGSLDVDVYDGTWHEGVWSRSGQQHGSTSDPWSTGTVELAAYGGQSGIIIRFRGNTGSGYRSDMAVDEIVIYNTATLDQDSDGDGMTDADEQIAGTGINDPDEFFQVGSAITTATGTTIGWDVVTGRLYAIYWSGDLVNQPFTELTNGLTGGSFEDTAHAAGTNGFYLIKVELAP